MASALKRLRRLGPGVGAACALFACSIERAAPRAPDADGSLVIEQAAPEQQQRQGSDLGAAKGSDAGAKDDADANGSMQGSCERNLHRWAKQLGAIRTAALIRTPCAPPCAPRVRGTYLLAVGGSYAQALSAAQSASTEMGVVIEEWTPMEDDELRLVAGCDAE